MKKIKISNNSVQIMDEDIKKKIDKLNISPSLINNWLSSPGDAIMDKFIMEFVRKEEPVHLIRGNWFHSIMEDFFTKSQNDRSALSLKESCKRVTKEKYPNLATNTENQKWLINAIKNYYETWGENAKNEKVAEIFIQGELQEGLELFVRGNIGNAERTCLGFIDRILETDYGLSVQDWKTGKHVSNYNPNKPISSKNPFDYWRQQIFYTMLLENMGLSIENACLIFPCSTPPTIVDIDIHLEKAREQTIIDCETVDKEISTCVNNDYTFPFKAGQWTSWASYLCNLGNAKSPDIHEDKLLDIAELQW